MMTAILFSGLTLTSCFYEDENNTAEPVKPSVPTPELSDYTVIFYTTGGGNLDYSIQNDFVGLCKALGKDNKKVRILVQYKYSKELPNNISGKAGHLYRFELSSELLNETTDAEKRPLKLTDDMLYGTQQAAAELYQPDSIASFIQYCKDTAPAQNYVFMMSDHGAGYQIVFDYDKSKVSNTRTRAMMSDDNLPGDPIMTNHELLQGIRKSGVHMKMMNFDCCLMNNLETLTEFKGVTDYVIASGHTTIGQDPEAFVRMLENAGANGENLQEWGQKFVEACAKKTAEYLKNDISPNPKAQNVDFNITDMTKFGNVLTTLKACTDYLLSAWEEQQKDKDAAAAFENKLFDPNNNCYQYNPQAPLYDAGDYMRLLSEITLKETQDASGNTFAPLYKAFYDACKAALICHAQSITSADCEAQDLTYSITLGCKGFIGVTYDSNSDDYPAVILGLDMDGKPAQLTVWNDYIEPYTYADADRKAWYGNRQQAFAWANSYCTTAFDQQIGWSCWLKVNPVYSYNNPPHDNRADALGFQFSKYTGMAVLVMNFSRETLKYFRVKYKRNDNSEKPLYSYTLNYSDMINQSYTNWPYKEDITVKLERKEDATGAWEIKLQNSLLEISTTKPSTEEIFNQARYPLNVALTGKTAEEADEAASHFYFHAILYINAEGKVWYELYDTNDNEATEWPFKQYVGSKNQ